MRATHTALRRKQTYILHMYILQYLNVGMAGMLCATATFSRQRQNSQWEFHLIKFKQINETRHALSRKWHADNLLHGFSRRYF